MGLVEANGKVITSAKYQLGEDDEVTVKTLPKASFDDQTLPVVYEDEHVVVINKPVGVLTHAKGALTEEFSVADFVRRHYHCNCVPGACTSERCVFSRGETEQDVHEVRRASIAVEKHAYTEELSGVSGSARKQAERCECHGNRPGIVHRLDRATSGIIIVAKDSETKRLLQKQFQDRKAHKTYVAIVKGTPKHPEAKIDLPIGRNPKVPSSFRVDAKGKPAVTTYKTLASNGTYSVVELKPETGRTHQLRVHLAYIGCPIVGDTLYGGGKSPIDRMCLHAKELEITIPVSERRTFDAPLPDDMAAFVEEIGHEAR